MTLPRERFRAVTEAERLLFDLIRPGVIPRVPTHVRERANRILKHFPTEHEMEQAAKAAPDMFKSHKEAYLLRHNSIEIKR